MTKQKQLRKSDKEYLRKILKAEKILRDPNNVCYNASALNSRGEKTSPVAFDARNRFADHFRGKPVSWCLVGALDKVEVNISDDLYGQRMFESYDMINFHDNSAGIEESPGTLSAMFLGFVRLFAEDVIRSRP